MSPVVQLAVPLDGPVTRIALAGALGLFLGLEREWSDKPAGIRTFSLISLLGAVFTTLGRDGLLAVGGVLVIVQGTVLAIQGLRDEDLGLSLTTSVSMLVAYGVGALTAAGFVIESVTVAVLSSLLLVLKRELHTFAGALSREELRSTTEFAILAFVVYPLLPTGDITLGSGPLAVELEPRVVWLMVVAVAAIGIVNYTIVRTYGGRGIAVTGFFGGLASSTAVVGTMLDSVRQRPAATSYAVAAVLLADAAMALRNLAIVLAFTFPDVLVGALVPLVVVVVGSVAIAAVTADWNTPVEMELDSPFSLRNVLAFGAMFTVVVLAGGIAQSEFGEVGFYVTAVLSGLVSSAGATASTVSLYRTGSLAGETAVIAVLLATASSIVVKAALTAAGPSRSFASRVALWSAVLLAGSLAAAVLVTL
ncbi:MgtC/SapB family protein [Halococcus thailandensis]|uniref:Magnesium transporter accessory protein n=1 Tax=Halococcus thailandensis JCM 13552 TaxID=1227457 RepID=M0MVN4_9EURY|nr:MgtC/SapB family protein [Halococcus thailandensis]EMA49661.1 magnesium transporter accessory protein [Halococcus thailandensis JCM 13552]